MKVSVIVAVYKDVESLGLILESLYTQTYLGDYEVIVAEDGKSTDMKNFIKSVTYPNLFHTTQVDAGWQKNKSINNALKIARGDLVIFLDGDCVPYVDLIENYVRLSKPKVALAGRRVELGVKYSEALRSKTMSAMGLQKGYLTSIISLLRDNTKHYEEGLKLGDFLFHLKYKDKDSHLLGCNFAVNKEDILAINGFDEDYITPSVGEDTDIEYRLIHYGCYIKPARNKANIFHLYHANTYSQEDNEASKKVFKHVVDNVQIICKNGIKKLR